MLPAFRSASARALRGAREFSTLNLGNTAWAFATAGRARSIWGTAPAEETEVDDLTVPLDVPAQPPAFSGVTPTQVSTLSNGLIVASSDAPLPATTVGVYVNAGSCCDVAPGALTRTHAAAQDTRRARAHARTLTHARAHALTRALAGTSHVLQHMAFKSAANYSQLRMVRRHFLVTS